MVQLNSHESENFQDKKMPSSTSSHNSSSRGPFTKGSKIPLTESSNGTLDERPPQGEDSKYHKRGSPDWKDIKPPRRLGHHESHKENHRREPLGGEDRLPPSKRRSPRHNRSYSTASVSSTSGAATNPRYKKGYPYADPYGSRPHEGGYDPHMYYYYQKMWEQHPYYRDYYRQYYGRAAYSTAGGESILDDKASTRSGRSSVNDEMKKSSLSSMAPYDPYGAYYGRQTPTNISSQFRQDFLGNTSVGAFEPSPIYQDSRGPYGQIKSYPSGEISAIPSVTDEVGSDANQRLSPHLFNGPHLAARFTPGGKLLLVLPSDPKEGETPRVQIRNVQKMLSVDVEYEQRIAKFKAYPGPLTKQDTHKDVVIKYCLEKSSRAAEDKNLYDRESVSLFWEYLSLLVKQNGKVCGVDLANLLLKGKEISLPSVVAVPEEGSRLALVTDDSSPQDEGIDVNVPELAEQIQTFTQYLCLGRKREAVDYAVRESLWGYAMTLASKMDSATHQRVMGAFLNSIPKSDVLHTLVQHLAGKKPQVAKNYSSDRWGDWRQHLAIMVANPTLQPQRDGASAVAMGDILASKGRLHAAHLCYLAADVQWGTYSDKRAKIVLIGSSHQQPFQTFASEEAIHCTEIYEFAKSQDNSHPTMTHFQSYKLIYALRLAECGFPNEALKYCEVISHSVAKAVGSFQVEFLSQVVDLASQLKYHDVHYQLCEGEMSEMSDPEWLIILQNALYNLQYELEAKRSVVEKLTDQVVTEEPPQPPPDQFYPQGYNTSSFSPQDSTNVANQQLKTPYQEQEYANQQEAVVKQEIATAPHNYPKEEPIEPVNSDEIVPEVKYEESLHQGSPHPMDYQQQQQQPPYANNWPQQQQQQWQPEVQQPPQSWQQQQGQWNEETPPPVGSNQWEDPVLNQPGSQSPPSAAPVERSQEELEYMAMMSGKGDAINSSPSEAAPKEADAKKEKVENFDEKKSGFLGSLFSWGGKKGKVATLPDDKNPSIIWDEQKQKWVNRDGDDDVDNVLPPPPPASMTAPPTSSFRGGIKKSRYVDLVGDKDRTKPPSNPLMPPMPSGAPTSFPLQTMEPTSFGAPEQSASEPSAIPPQGSQANGGSVPMMGAVGGPQGQPMFFNPAQMPPVRNSGAQQPKRTGPGRRVFNTPR